MAGPCAFQQSLRRTCALLSMTVLWACDPVPDDGPDLTETTLSTDAQVSNLISRTAASGVSASILAAGGGDNLVYVSLPEGVVPTGVSAEVRRKGDEVPVITKMLDGGFDPVMVVAAEGDSIEIVVKNGSGQVLFMMKEGVKTKRLPSVVRTWPPRRKSDMPVNATMFVVISEPIDKRTVTSSSVRLFAGRNEIPGQARVLDDGTSVAFTPAAPLAPQREYRLVLSKSITDLEGEALAADVVVGFQTGTSLVGPPASIAVSPDSVFLLVGSSYQFSAHVFDAAGNLLMAPVTWKTSTLDVISISQTGLVTGKQSMFINRATWAAGTVEASVGMESRSAYDSTSGISSTAHVVVVPQPGSIELVPSAAALAVGDTLAFEVVTRATNDVFNWRIMVPLTIGNSNPAAASVSVPSLSAIEISPLRTLKALAAGTTRITVKAGGLSATMDVTVTPQLPIAAVRVAPAAAEMMAQETLQLTAWLRDTEGKTIQGARPITWQSSNASVATVDGSGRVTAVGTGSTTISAASEGKSGSTSIIVSTQPAGPTFVALAAEFGQTCGVTATKDTYCWGLFYNAGTSFKLRVPTLLPGGMDLVDMTPGGESTPGFLCGRANAGETFCWPYFNSIPSRFAPTLTFSDLSVSHSGHACGVATNGTTYCWGMNTFGQLGDGTTQSRHGTPTPVAGGHAFKTITAGRDHTCGITSDGDAYCWGYNRYWLGSQERLFVPGVLGTGDTTSETIRTPARVVGGHTFVQLSAGTSHTCGLTTAGQAYCWGLGGLLGDSTSLDRSVPVAVATSLRFTGITVGSFTCAIAVGGAAYCWGYNFNGGLGVDGESQRQPVAVQGNLSFVHLAVGALHACGITTTGRTYCWGDNASGNLGDGSTTTSRSMPMPVARPNP